MKVTNPEACIFTNVYACCGHTTVPLRCTINIYTPLYNKIYTKKRRNGVRTEVGEPPGKLSERTLTSRKHKTMPRAVHGLHSEFLALHVEEEHVVLVVRSVARCLPQLVELCVLCVCVCVTVQKYVITSENKCVTMCDWSQICNLRRVVTDLKDAHVQTCMHATEKRQGLNTHVTKNQTYIQSRPTHMYAKNKKNV